MRPILTAEAEIDYLLDADLNPVTGNGPLKDASRYREARAQFRVAGTWDVTLQGSIDGVVFTDLAANVTANAITEIPEWWRYYRLVTNVVGDRDDIAVTVGGFTVGDWA